jgi:hypothetical protein
MLSSSVLLSKPKEKKIHGLSPQANYTDRATAACQRSQFQLFADRGCHVVNVTIPYGHILSCAHEAELPRSRPATFFCSAGNRTRDLRICSISRPKSRQLH